jgi:hypothetical protein
MIAAIEGWPPEWLSYAPDSNCWSVIQLFEHLMLSERAVRLSCERNAAAENREVTFAERWRTEIFLIGMRLPIRIRIPKVLAASIQPGAHRSLHSVIEEWDSERRLLFDFLGTQNNRSRHKIAMRHPATGALGLETALRFLCVHLWHHKYQFLRLRWRVTKCRSV